MTEVEPTGVVLDAMGLVQALGKPAGATTFGDVARAFSALVRSIGERYDSQRVDIVFDRYDPHSIKSVTRAKRQKRHAGHGEKEAPTSPGHNINLIEAAMLPSEDWKCFLNVPSNKSRLACFLGSAVLRENYDFTVVVSGAFEHAEEVKSNTPEMDLSPLSAAHEEADTRLLLHVKHMPQSRIIVYSRDTDVLVLLIYQCERLPARQLWMRTGSNKDHRYIPIHDVVKTLPSGVVKELLAFHAFTGSDTTSFFFRKGKKGAWKTFLKHPALLQGLGKGSEKLSSETERHVETFVSRWYGLSKDIDSVDQARATLFQQGRHVSSLPPTADALRLHLVRCRHQAAVWEKLGVVSDNSMWCSYTLVDLMSFKLVPKAKTCFMSMSAN